MIASLAGRLGRSTAAAISASSRGARIRAIHGSEVNFSARWASHPMTLKYSNDDLRSLYFEFEKYAEAGEMNVDNFERMVVEKTAHFQSSDNLDPMISMASWWQKFDEDANDHVDFSEFVNRYPSMVRRILRKSVRISGAKAFYEEFAVDGKFTEESVLAAVSRYGLGPLPEADVDKLMKQISPFKAFGDHEDIEFWAEAEDYSSVSCSRGSSVFHKDFYEDSSELSSMKTSANACVEVP
jgi:hypothetical protein